MDKHSAVSSCNSRSIGSNGGQSVRLSVGPQRVSNVNFKQYYTYVVVYEYEGWDKVQNCIGLYSYSARTFIFYVSFNFDF